MCICKVHGVHSAECTRCTRLAARCALCIPHYEGSLHLGSHNGAMVNAMTWECPWTIHPSTTNVDTCPLAHVFRDRREGGPENFIAFGTLKRGGERLSTNSKLSGGHGSWAKQRLCGSPWVPQYPHCHQTMVLPITVQKKAPYNALDPTGHH